MQSLTAAHDFPVAVVWLRERPEPPAFRALPAPNWLPPWVDLVPFAQRPGRHELHEQGACYCLDPSSVFMAQGLSAVTGADTVLDVCASPGGKSVMAWRALQPSRLFSNEVIGKRIGALISNLKRCQIAPVSVLSVDTVQLPTAAAGAFDVVLVDAPCSGQSLIARGKPSPGCFHPATINMNANRQRRILANSMAAVKPGGWLIYMTCTYSLKENERNVDWLLKKHPTFEAQQIPILAAFRSDYTTTPCYRMWPMSEIGAGGFVCALRNVAEDNTRPGSRGVGLSSVPVRWSA
ncbi:MAG: RsmB/NOP family class I SAM-dependent RNA methyltransferase [Fuerstiella sp.]